MSAIELRQVRKSFGATDVIHGVDLSVEKGEFVVFVGPSGCGKSTLLRMIAGLEDISAGEVLIDGEVVNEVEPARRGLSMVFQSYALYPHMSVAGNMSFGLRMTGTSKAETERRVKEAAAILQLEPLMKRKPSQLSGGQRQRVAIGRAIVRQPKAFLFDEPLSNLDAELRVAMRVEIAKLHQDLGATMIYVTHDQVEAMTLADRIVVLRAGRIEQVGTPAQLYADPDNVFVAGFIGSPRMNLINAVSDGRTISIGDLALTPTLAGALPAGPVTLGLRPEQFEGGDGETARLSVAVEVVENLGGTSVVHGRLPDGQTILVEQRGKTRSVPQDRLETAFAVSDLLVFDAEGQRLR
ncbi:sn-glycerol-3-phosphate ABC transporter ATP-binding protein UgpC [Devosia sp. SD17-2]|jgi:lactose/L-arabinose transport system ATP-binding protein|uniref:ABC transporter ATP-binding protein n=1 Tax=Devosia sp. SD17-2 TaxID=2976459 RepID=UPI0023D80F37|nr:sn-glycerol-3-phosphate ABC transporter ATP-binding protein UgpC [Devosia sp. SD17-2]WEJ34588.1 sn-glycerol-3-phosphate ABC transporter ATP-binding protein UgpC [Devosia sp. SD17-2]